MTNEEWKEHQANWLRLMEDMRLPPSVVTEHCGCEAGKCLLCEFGVEEEQDRGEE